MLRLGDVHFVDVESSMTTTKISNDVASDNRITEATRMPSLGVAQ